MIDINNLPPPGTLCQIHARVHWAEQDLWTDEYGSLFVILEHINVNLYGQPVSGEKIGVATAVYEYDECVHFRILFKGQKLICDFNNNFIDLVENTENENTENNDY